MTVCQICGNKGYSKLLTHCVQCRDVAVHRYCVLGPSIFEDEEIKWSCEFCDPGKTEPTEPSRKNEGLSSTLEQAALQKTAGKNLRTNLCPSHSEKPDFALKETAKGATDLSILDQKFKDGSVRRKQAKLKEIGSPVLPHVSDATEVLPAIDTGKGDNSYNNANECKQELPQGKKHSGKLKRLADAKKGKKIKDPIFDNGVKKGCFVSSQETEQKIKNMNSSDITGHQKVKMGKNAGPLLSEVEDIVSESTRMAGDCNQGDSKLVKQQKLTSRLLPKKKSHIEKASCEVLPKHLEESYINKNLSRDADLADHADDKKTRVEETEQKIKNMNSSDIIGHQKVKIGKNVGPLSSEVEDIVNESTRMARDGNQGDSKLVKQQKLTSRLLPKKKSHIEIASCEVLPKHLEDSYINKNLSRDADVADHADNKKTGVEETEQKIKNMTSSDITGHQKVKMGKNVGPLSSEVEDIVNESTRMARDGNQGDSKIVKQQKLTSHLLPKKKSHIEKASCEVLPKHLEESYINKNLSRDADLADHADNKKTGVEETAVVLDKQANVQSNRDVSECKAPRKKRKLVIEMEYSDEDPVFVVAKHPHVSADVGKDPSSKSSSEAFSKLSDDGLAQLSSVESVPTRPSPRKVDDRVLTRESSVVVDNYISTQPPPTKLVNYVPAQPLIDAAWRGYCSITNNEYPMSLALEAHLSNKALEKVQGAVSLLPEYLNFDLVPKKYAWPKTFEESPPTSDFIGIYLFPVDERAEKLYDCLVEKMIGRHLVLKSIINNLELLVFCSLELPREEWSFLRKYYLWGAFKPRKDPIMPNNQPRNRISNVQLPRDVLYQQKDLSSQLGQIYSSPTNCSNTHFCQEPVGQSDVLTRPICLKPHDQTYNMRGHDIHPKRNPTKSRKPQDREHCHDAEFSDYGERNRYYRGRSDRWNKHSGKHKNRDRKNSGHSHKLYRSNMY